MERGEGGGGREREGEQRFQSDDPRPHFLLLSLSANVRSHTEPCSKLWSPTMAAAAYANKYAFCANNIVWGSDELCRSVGETGCVV